MFFFVFPSFLFFDTFPKMIDCIFSLCMIMPGGGSRLQIFGGVKVQLFGSTLSTYRISVCFVVFFKSILDTFMNTIVYFSVCMILPGGGSRLQTLGVEAQLFDSTLHT